MNSRLIKCASLSGMVLFVIISCAKIGTPTGGIKDIIPPKMEGSKPEAYATNFDGKKIDIMFDEFIQLKDLNKSFVVSPPMKKKPEVTARGKTVEILLNEDLKPNTTYRFYFGDAIVDFHESNPIRNFDFVVSTGNYIDSLVLRGRVLKAFDEQPNKDGIFVMLYSKFQDSIPRKQLPDYISKANAEGWFTLSHIRSDSFMVFALNDLNQNYLFDNPGEAIAFSDTLVQLSTKNYLPKDSLFSILDTLRSDSLRKILAPFKPEILLYSFVEHHQKQYVKKYTRTVPEKLEFMFNTQIYDTLELTPLNFLKKNWSVSERPIRNDSIVTYWITDTAVIHQDTLRFKVTYNIKDSVENLKPKSDTITLTYRKPKGRQSKKQGKLFNIECSCAGKSMVDITDKILLNMSMPVKTIDNSKIYFFRMEEGKASPVKFELKHDSSSILRYVVNFKMESDYDYVLTLDTLAITSLYQNNNDSTTFKFKTQKEDYYGTIKMNLSNVNDQMIVQLLDPKENLVQQKIIDKNQIVVFNYLNPGKYMVKVIYDNNHNKLWDTGDFKKKMQPERVLYFNKELTVRSNWDDEETWELDDL